MLISRVALIASVAMLGVSCTGENTTPTEPAFPSFEPEEPICPEPGPGCFEPTLDAPPEEELRED